MVSDISVIAWLRPLRSLFSRIYVYKMKLWKTSFGIKISKVLTWSKIRTLFSKSGIWETKLTKDLKREIEKAWKDKQKILYDEVKIGAEPYYILAMFPYPSGRLHMGHVRVYTMSDTLARFYAMNGKNVLHPMGWDAFGLPAENAALERKLDPRKWTRDNIEVMKKQLQSLGCYFHWDREIATNDPSYYRWTQWIFLKLLEKGLVYQKKAFVNWDPVDETVLANEQVDEKGKSWRSGATVEQRLLNQWWIRGSVYARDMYEGLSEAELKGWRDVVDMQRHWIGEPTGVQFHLKVVDASGEQVGDELTVWTKNPEHLENSAFVILRENHSLSPGCSSSSAGPTPISLFATNPLSGRQLPIYVGSYELMDEESDSYLGIPGLHREDREFCIRHDIDILNSLASSLDCDTVIKKTKALGAGGYWTSPRLRDWLISRQRFWGTPIPVIHCNKCGVVPVPKEQLPVCLPEVAELKKKGNSTTDEWLHIKCTSCGGNAVRETDTMDTFVDSSWYYLRYLDPHNKDALCNTSIASKFLPVDVYVGGKEHATLHLYYARIIHRFLKDEGLVDCLEPFSRLLLAGQVMSETFKVKKTGKYIPKEQVEITGKRAVERDTGSPVSVSWEKMSKSRFNGVDPETAIEEDGIDTVRLVMLGNVNPEMFRKWSKDGVYYGTLKWQNRVWKMVGDYLTMNKGSVKESKALDNKSIEMVKWLWHKRNYHVKCVSNHIRASNMLNAALSNLQGLTNNLKSVINGSPLAYESAEFERALADLIIMLFPFAPHFSSELWSGFSAAISHRPPIEGYAKEKHVFEQKWPSVDKDYPLLIVIKINGREIGSIPLPYKELELLSSEEAIDLAVKDEKIKNLLKDDAIQRTHYIYHPEFAGEVRIETEA